MVDVTQEIGPGGRVVGTWRPLGQVRGPAALVLGRTAADWQVAGPAFNQPGTLAAAGWHVLALATPNWGNQVDMTSIDAVLAWAADRGFFVDRLLLVGHNAGAVSALNWTLRNFGRASALSLQSPIIDLAERWTRVTADRASLEAAYGGSQATFDAAMPTWNPNTVARAVRLRDVLHDRIDVYRSPDATQTPPAVTDLISQAIGATVHTIASPEPTAQRAAPILATSEPKAADIGATKIALDRMSRMTQYIRAGIGNEVYRGGDGSSSVQLPVGQSLADFPGAALPATVWFYADTFVGSVDPDDTFGGLFVLRNSIIVEDAHGALLGQHFGPGPGPEFAPLRPDPGTFPDMWYWPIDVTLDTLDRPVVACWLVEAGGNYGHLVDSHLVRLDPSTLDVAEVTPLQSATDTFWLESFLEHDGFVYVYAQEYVPDYDSYGPDAGTRQRLARVSAADLATPAAWRYWDGTAYVANQASSVRLRDDTGAEIRDDACVTATADGFLMAVKRVTTPGLLLYTAPAPEGPWHLEGVHPDLGDSGSARYGGIAFSYHPKFHEQFAMHARGTTLLTYNTNLFAGTVPITSQDLTQYQPRNVAVNLAGAVPVRPRRRSPL